MSTQSLQGFTLSSCSLHWLSQKWGTIFASSLRLGENIYLFFHLMSCFTCVQTTLSLSVNSLEVKAYINVRKLVFPMPHLHFQHFTFICNISLHKYCTGLEQGAMVEHLPSMYKVSDTQRAHIHTRTTIWPSVWCVCAIPVTREAKAGSSQVQCQPWLNIKPKVLAGVQCSLPSTTKTNKQKTPQILKTFFFFAGQTGNVSML